MVISLPCRTLTRAPELPVYDQLFVICFVERHRRLQDV